MKVERELLYLLAPAAYLFVLPVAHATALRSIAFGMSILLLLWAWRGHDTRDIPLKAPFAAWLALALVTLIWAIYPKFSIAEIRTEILYGFLTFLIFFKGTRSDRELNFWLLTLAGSALLVGMSSLIHWLRGLNPYLVGFHGGTLYYAGYLNTIFPVLMAMAILQAGRIRIALICLMVLLLVTAVGSTSRAVWVGFLLEFIVFGGLYLKFMEVSPVAKKRALVVGISIVVLFSGVLLYVVKEKLSLSGGPMEILAQAAKADQRPKLWRDSIAFIQERPYTGAGFGRMVLGRELATQQQDPNHTHAHNIVLNSALQLGLLGPVVLVFFFYSILRELWKLVQARDADLKILGIAGISLLGGIFAQSMVEDILVKHLAWLFWALLGMTLGYAAARR
jgi:O-antigen ligase